MWTMKQCEYVDGRINEVRDAFIFGMKDDLNDRLYAVEKDTGYDIEYLYDIFVEILEDEAEDNISYESAVHNAVTQTIISAYELDYDDMSGYPEESSFVRLS